VINPEVISRRQEDGMHLFDWIRDGFLGDRTRLKHVAGGKRAEAREERPDPSGPHHFGRRAHRPDPNGHYGFDPEQRSIRKPR
jgi:hypothetical protein